MAKVTDNTKNAFYYSYNREVKPIPRAEGSGFQEFIAQIDRSPHLVNNLNSFVNEHSGQIIVHENSAILNDGNKIYLPLYSYAPHLIQNTTIVNFDEERERLAVGLGHELGHGINPEFGKYPEAANPTLAVQMLSHYEGNAIYNEYMVANDFRAYRRAHGESNPTVVTWTPEIMEPLDDLAKKYPIDSIDFQREAIEIAGAIALRENPSGATLLTYTELAELQWIYDKMPIDIANDGLETLRGVTPYQQVTRLVADNVILSQSIKPTDFHFETNANGETIFAITLPVVFLDQNGNELTQEQHNFVGKTDALGQVIDMQHLPDTPQFNPKQAIQDYHQHSIVLNSKELQQIELSPDIQALHDKIGEALHPRLAALNVNRGHANAMVSTHTLDCVKAGICADDIKFTSVDTKHNLISTSHAKSEWIGVYTDAVAASRNNPEQTLQQAEQQPMQEMQKQQQLEQQTKEHSSRDMGM